MSSLWLVQMGNLGLRDSEHWLDLKNPDPNTHTHTPASLCLLPETQALSLPGLREENGEGVKWVPGYNPRPEI